MIHLKSKDQKKPVQPYAVEAGKYLDSYLRNAKLTMQYDNNQKTDRYDRHLVYLYAKKHDRDKDKLACEATKISYQTWMKNN
ncbi:thermonuclease family protein [Macrococcus armenti]|uniref:thermonuclease family protein n=1 Tax=Macrococcus armenti TaxID=2875764 RepID=UPI001CCB518D|nr:thermonuclease family protein [Macrococcus armenti]UBH08034.1 thermonuclease family protein [Macrococcus armenti]UBH10266.1 thermonuclease family protein [Macrococcus armenti]